MQSRNSSTKPICLRNLALFLLAAVLLSHPHSASAQTIQSAGGPTDPIEVQTFVDGLMTEYLSKYHIASATIAIVGGGELVYAQGYGSADMTAGTPVDAYRHLFRIGSTSKVFVWTAVMQLVEQGKLDLDADINSYLTDFQIKTSFPQPITMRHLMSHTAGFEEGGLGLEAASIEDQIPLSELVSKYQRIQVKPAGEINAYSNYGNALAAYIVEVISGMPFYQYAEENIFNPLGMQRSTFRQSLPDHLAGDLARGYGFNGEFVEMPFAVLNAYPAGGMSATSTDVAKFMIALMQDDCQANPCVVQPDTFEQMRQRIFPQDLRLDGMAYGLMDSRANGYQLLYHGGDISPYHGILVMHPESKSGFYICFDGDASVLSAEAEFITAFLDHYFPYQPEITAGKAITPVEQLTGTYRTTRFVYTSPERISEIMGFAFIRVASNEVGDINILGQSAVAGPSNTFMEVEPLVFRSSDGYSTAIFKPDTDGSGMVLFFSNEASMAFEKIPWIEAPTFNRIVLVVCVILIVIYLLARLIGLFLKRKPSSTGAKRARALLVIDCLSYAALVAVVAWMLTSASTGSFAFQTYHRWILLAIAWLIVLLTAAVIVAVVQVWRNAYWKLSGRIHYTLTGLACTAAIWLLVHWNFLRFNF